ncbi:MAG: metallophosphoesterase [bacterium]
MALNSKQPFKWFIFLLLSLFFLPTKPADSKVKKHNPPPPAESKAAPTAPPSVHFFTFGDWGSGTKDQKAVAEEAKKICGQLACDFGLFLGDNFYPAGVSSTEDPYWKTRYRDVYTSLKIPFYAALGNHDWKGNPQAQIDFTKKDEYWKMPNYQYSVKLRPPSMEKALVEIFVLDSDRFDATAQEWLKKALGESEAGWKILAFHHPILNNGTEHPSDEKKMWPALKPIVCKKIDLILSGHEHIFSHLREEKNECQYDQVIVGTGGKELYGIRPIAPAGIKPLFSESSFGVAFFEATPQELSLRFFRADGTEAYRYQWKKP